MKMKTEMSDREILRELGSRLERRRIDAGLTQAELAERAGVSKRTVERIEAGISTDFTMLIRALRVLKLIDGLETLVPDLPTSPLALLKLKGREPKRVRHSPTKGRRSAVQEPPARPWKWGE
jgi:transcriptional regulator with XRE-family HTH domain